MSEDEYQQIVERVQQSVANPMISTDTGVEAVQRVGQLAAQEQVEWAVAGGLAMHLYGSSRLTKEVDIIASNHLSLTPQHRLSFGGSSYTLKIGKYAVQVDWIVRNDGYEKYYRAAQPVPRHREIKDYLARHIIKMLSNPPESVSGSGAEQSQ